MKKGYKTGRFFFDFLLIISYIQIAFGTLLVMTALLSSQGSMFHFDGLSFWIGVVLILLGLAEIAATQVSIAIFDIADNIRAMKEGETAGLQEGRWTKSSQRSDPVLTRTR